MPLYEYQCKDCQTNFDALVRRREDADGVCCRSCASSNVRRLVSGFAMVGGYDDQITMGQTANGGGGCCGGSCGCHH